MDAATIGMAIVQLAKLGATLAKVLENDQSLSEEQREQIRQSGRDADALWQSIPDSRHPHPSSD